MNILLVSLYLPKKRSEHAGGRYVYELVSQLIKKHEVHILTMALAKDSREIADLATLGAQVSPYFQKPTERSLRGFLQRSLDKLRFSALADKTIRGGSYDVVQVEWVETAILIRKCATPMILNAHDVITKPRQRLFLAARGPHRWRLYTLYYLTRVIESWIMRRFDAVVALSRYDQKYLTSMHLSPQKVSVISPPAGADITEKRYEKTPGTVLFLASYRQTYVASAKFLYSDVLPIVHKTLPYVRLILAGSGATDEMKSWAKNDDRVEVPGFVDDADALYKRSTMFVAPILTGGGIIVKILDALAAGVPVITTPFGNEGIQAIPEKDLIIAHNAKEFADAIIRIQQDKGFAARLAENGQRFVRARFQIESTMRGFEELYGALLAKKRAMLDKAT